MPEKSLSGNVDLIPECELRAEGNYAIAPPSRAISKKDKKREYVLYTTGYILSTDVYTSLQLATREDKKMCLLFSNALSMKVL